MIPLGSLIFTRLLHPRKAESLIPVNRLFSSKVTVVGTTQLLNAPKDMVFMIFGTLGVGVPKLRISAKLSVLIKK